MNKISKWLTSLELLLGPVIANAADTSGAVLDFTVIDFPGASQGSGQGTQVRGINDSGQIVGFYYDSTGAQHAFEESGSIFTTLQISDSTSSNAYGINNSGQIVGEYVDANNEVHNFLMTGTTIVSIDDPNATPEYQAAYSVNNLGQVVGFYDPQNGTGGHGFLTDGPAYTTYTTVGPPDAITVGAIGINDSGEIVGDYASNAGYTNGWALINGEYTTFSVPGGGETLPDGVNAAGTIVGYFGGNPFMGFQMTSAGVFTLFSAPNAAEGTIPWSINSQGQIAGWYVDSAGVQHGFIASPAPAAPGVTYTVTGTLGLHGWYISATTVSWTVTGYPTPTTSGCATVSVPDTKGITYRCSATNSLGSASDSVRIKKDSVAPQVTITRPVKGKTYTLDEKVLASYTCLDALSGVAKCWGTVQDGAAINTSSKGTKTFKVIGTDEAGNKTTDTVLYSVK